MDKREKLEMLQRLSEKKLTKRILIPLYESKGMGCKNVCYTHGILEFGKDIIYFKDDEHGNRIYTGVQVKKSKITSKNNDSILRQITEAFGEPFTDSSDGKKKEIDKLIVLTSNEFLRDAKKSLWASLKGVRLNRLVTLIDGNQLVGLLDKNLQSAFWDEYDYFNKYFNSMKEDFEKIKDISAIGRKEPLPLENIFVSLKVSEKATVHEIPTEKGRKIFEAELIKSEVERQVGGERIIDSEEAVKDYDRLVMVGVPGSGKTTLLKHIALKSCKENLEKQERTCIPVPITLREFSESGKDLRGYINEVFEKYKFPKVKELINKDLKEGKCRLLLDGFDELATRKKQEKIIKDIHDFVDKHPKCQIIVTSRIAGYNDELKGFTKFELIEFDDAQIEKFVANWFGKTNPERAKSMLESIKDNEQIKAIARNPLMIAIIAIIHEEDKKLPQKRATLYNRCIEVMLSKWDVQRRIKNKFPSDKKEFILRKLAFYGHTNNKRVMTEKEIMKEMLRYFPYIQLKKEDAKSFLDEIWQRSHILGQISMDCYEFLHLSFQEYFTALELKELDGGLSIIISHLLEPWWGEPILLYAGISKDATALIKRIKKEVPEDIFYCNLILFGRCIADAEFTDPSLRREIVKNLLDLYLATEFSNLKDKITKIVASIDPDAIVKLLISQLKDKDNKERRAAASALGDIESEKAIEPLIKALATDKESEVRGAAASALGDIGSEKAIEPLIKTLADKESEVREAAASALGDIESEKAIEPLIKALADKKSEARGAAASALGYIGSEKAIEPLIKALATDKDSEARGAAASALGYIESEKAIEPLKGALEDEEYGVLAKVKEYAFNSLERISRKNMKRIPF